MVSEQVSIKNYFLIGSKIVDFGSFLAIFLLLQAKMNVLWDFLVV